MKLLSFAVACTLISMLAGCSPTVTHYSVVEKVDFDGGKTVTKTRAVTQRLAVSETDATKAMLNMK